MGRKAEHLKSRNEEIRQVWNHLRRVERRESSYCIEQIRQNYHISSDLIYDIISKDSEPDAIANPSLFYQSIVK